MTDFEPDIPVDFFDFFDDPYSIEWPNFEELYDRIGDTINAIEFFFETP